MKTRIALASLATVALLASLSACGVGYEVSSRTETVTSSAKYTCKLNGSCYTCPSSSATMACARDGAAAAGCSPASTSVCD
jgi:hypothetical protein